MLAKTLQLKLIAVKMNPSGGDGAGDGPFHNYGECLPSDFVRWGSVAYRQPSIPPNSRAIQGRSLFSMTGGSTPIPENPIFDVKELIGSGSYSNVYRAIDKIRIFGNRVLTIWFIEYIYSAVA
ncbi:hypothetical protein NQ317_018611 [Molorchus minor]|uniref:Uncharacterized protein n=1 Tax=Molorchus minor TaxID=1323400 RepID=A0ABQ9JGJ3_9CUCU|nr:hypothetical protein NQ317_018611 [Molorchus minor]